MKKNILMIFALSVSLQLNAQWNFLNDLYTSYGLYAHEGIQDFVYFNDSTGIYSHEYDSGNTTSSYTAYSIYGTNDYGNNWTTLYNNPWEGHANIILNLQMLGESDSVICSSFDHFELSTDHGHTWTSFCNTYTPSGIFDFLNYHHGLIHYGSTLYQYNNGTVTPLPALPDGGYITDIQMITPAKSFVIADSGNKLLVTNDSGYTWTVSLDTSTLFNHIEFTSPSIGYISCYNGQIYKTIDGGSSWNMLALPSTAEAMYWSSFMNDSIGLVAGDNATIYRTLDGGLTWTQQGIPTSDEIKKIQLINNVAYCITATGDMYNNITALSNNEIEKETAAFSIYPNPVSDFLTISNPQLKKINQVSISNSLGQVEYIQKLQNNSSMMRIDLSAMSKGVKYCTITGEGNYTVKMVVE